jgi:hypothetical protein
MKNLPHQLTHKLNIIFIIPVIFGLLLTASGCGADVSSDLQQEIRKYFYDSQFQPDREFVSWANKNLNGYSSRAVYSALYEEGKYHAGLGHPGAISLISFAAKDWAEAKDLSYDASRWEQLQEEAVKNMRTTPPGQLQIWE